MDVVEGLPWDQAEEGWRGQADGPRWDWAEGPRAVAGLEVSAPPAVWKVGKVNPFPLPGLCACQPRGTLHQWNLSCAPFGILQQGELDLTIPLGLWPPLMSSVHLSGCVQVQLLSHRPAISPPPLHGAPAPTKDPAHWRWVTPLPLGALPHPTAGPLGPPLGERWVSLSGRLTCGLATGTILPSG